MSTFFDQLRHLGETGLQDLVDQRQQEHVQLDFKLKSNPDHGSPNDDDKRTLSEALSGFSNSAGGTLVWGVDARKVDGIDCATGLTPIAEVEAFQSAVNSLIGQYLMPRHEGIQTAIIRSQGNPTRGYLLLDVERSERRPHRSEAKGKKGYFKRVGDSFFEMEHYDIEDAFKRNSVPDLNVRWMIEPIGRSGGPQGTRHSLRLSIGLTNVSPQTAKFPYLHVWKEGGASMFIPFDGYRVNREGAWTNIFGGADTVVHPEIVAWMVCTDIEIHDGEVRGVRIHGLRPPEYTLRVECRFGCENSRQQNLTIHLRGDDLLPLVGVA